MTRRLVTVHMDAGHEWRGGQQQALYLMRGLARLGHAAHIVTPPGSPLGVAAAADGFRVHAVAMRGEWDAASAWTIAKILRRERPDVVHYHDARSAGIGSMIPRRLLPATVITRRVDFPIGPTFLSRRKYGRCDVVIAVSNRIAEICGEAGVPLDRIAVVHDGIDTARFSAHPSREDARREMGAGEEAEVIGVVAALVDHKGHRYLLEALPALRRSHPGIRLWLAGDGPLRGSLQAHAASLGVADVVTFHGQVEDVPRFLSAIDVFVMPSHLEGLCQAVIEALAAGVPAVTTSAGGLPDIIVDGTSGLLVPPRDPAALASAISRVLEDSRLRQDLARSGPVRSRDFEAETMVRGTLASYERALAPSKEPFES